MAEGGVGGRGGERRVGIVGRMRSGRGEGGVE